MNDSTGQEDPIAYGFVNWNGNNWKAFRLKATATNGIITNAKPRSILVLSKDDIWFAGGSVFHFNGKYLSFSLERFKYFSGVSESINKLWGNKNDIYGIGSEGTIVHYDGATWTKIESGTDVDLLDVWGAEDGEVVWACGYEFDNSKTVLLKIVNGKVKSIYEGSPNNQNNGYYLNLMRGVFGIGNNRVLLMNGSRILTQPNSENLNLNSLVKLSDFGYAIGA